MKDPTRRVYSFEYADKCNMCGADPVEFRTMGLRLNTSQSYFPRKKSGIAVSVIQCRKCELIFPQPMPIPASVRDHYGVPPENYWHESYFKVPTNYLAREFETARTLIRATGPGNKALDIGAGVGKAMQALERHGFEAYGIEPSESFAARAFDTMQISRDRLQMVTVENAAFQSEFFDLITFGAVLEHLYDPNDAIRRALSWLRPGGIIQIEVPSSRYLVHRMINTFYRVTGTSFVSNLSPMHSPYHLYEFSLESFLKNGESLGYEVADSWFEVASGRFVPRLLYRFLHPLMLRTGTGMQLTVFLRKL